MRIRTAEEGDLGYLHAIQSAALAEPSPELLEAAIEGPQTLLVAVEDVPVGYVIALTPGGVAYLPELAVRPDRQGEGYGSALLDAVQEAVAEGHRTVRVTARAVDADVREFYENRGFTAVERVDGHFESGDGVIYERDL